MSPPDLRHPQSPANEDRTAQRRKAVLFCPECGHESHVRGDWIATDDYRSRTRQLRCPECTTTITDRALPTDSDTDRSGARPGSPAAADAGFVGQSFETAARLWRNSVHHWVQWSRRTTA